MNPEHYSKECGCKYTVGNPYPWLICPAHHAKGLRLYDPDKVLKIEYKHSDFPLANPDTMNADISSRLKYQANQKVQHYWLYALRLSDGRYYAGMTGNKNPYNRILMHGDFMGARWTMQHNPVELLEIRDIGRATKEVAEDMEHKLTLVYMELYGYRNVRGGKMTYTGSIFRVGKLFVRDQQIISAAMSCAALLAFGYYIANNY